MVFKDNQTRQFGWISVKTLKGGRGGGWKSFLLGKLRQKATDFLVQQTNQHTFEEHNSTYVFPPNIQKAWFSGFQNPQKILKFWKLRTFSAIVLRLKSRIRKLLIVRFPHVWTVDALRSLDVLILSIVNFFPKLMWHSSPEFVLPDLDLLSSARICCPRPTLHSHSLDIGSNSENIHLTLPFNSLNIHIPFFNSIPHYPILQGSSRSTELQLCTWLHLILTFIGTKYTFWGLLAAKLIEMPKSGPPETSQLCEYSEIYSVSLEMFATRGKCFKKMNTWNLTLLSFIDSSAERTSYFKCSGALQLSGL